ncbi:LytTR family DNA-binding domain-containing protein [uncultured Sphingomonas sp.]|uniref:LytTR family DNA-binding domain-containing protein n=1 Tax=uncultured Sphingomonas sp. TaxID=158754 RepID=UPI0025D68B13|nr:LytTR family DNA-binding domain-containing protein [uncultured Sphingomonas sp.]
MPAILAPVLRRASPRDKGDFAKPARRFVKSTRGRLPGFPLLWIACAGIAGLMIVTGGFRTDSLPLPQRAGFWLLLMGWNAVKWQLLFAWFVRKPQDWPRVAVIGTVLLNLPLPAEIGWSAAAVGVGTVAMPGLVWANAAAIGLMALTVCVATVRAMRPAASAPRPLAGGVGGGADVGAPDSAEAIPSPSPSREREGNAEATAFGTAAPCLLARARIAPDALLAVEAEDHYCRIRAHGGGGLHHYRFGDALAELAALDGAQVHRGAWVAAQAVTGARREGRRWLLQLADGSAVPVSATYLPEVRRRGWLPHMR